LRLTFILLFFTSLIFGQQKPIVFYNEIGDEVNRKDFVDNKSSRKNLDLYFETDTTQVGMLVTRKNYGQLDKKTFKNLKAYLTDLVKKQIEPTQNIVINYLTAIPKKADNTKLKSTWNILDKDYLKKLHKIADISHFWINSPKSDNIEYHHKNRINWISDKDSLLMKLFFEHEVRYGNYILIKLNGKFLYDLGEHSKYEIWEESKNFSNKKIPLQLK